MKECDLDAGLGNVVNVECWDNVSIFISHLQKQSGTDDYVKHLEKIVGILKSCIKKQKSLNNAFSSHMLSACVNR